MTYRALPLAVGLAIERAVRVPEARLFVPACRRSCRNRSYVPSSLLEPQRPPTTVSPARFTSREYSS